MISNLKIWYGSSARTPLRNSVANVDLSNLFFSVRLLSVLRGHSFFYPRHNGQWLRRISITDFIHYIFCSILILEKEPVFPFWMFSAKQGHYWYHFYNVFWYDAVLDWGLNPGPPALEASTLPLGYRGGGISATETGTIFTWTHSHN